MKKLIILGFSLTLLICSCDSKKSNYEKPVELRGVYLNSFDCNIFNSQRSIAEAMHFLGEHHFNAIFPEIRIAANMIYQCEIMDGLLGNTIDSLNADRDPLAELIYEAHRQGLKVIPRIEYGPISNSQKNEMLVSDTLLYWAVRDTAGNILKKNDFMWINLYHPAAQDLIINLFKVVITKYNIDGIQGGARLCSQPIQGGYSEYTRQLYADEHDGEMPPNEFLDDEWQSWRSDKINQFIRRVYKEIKATKPNILVCWSTSTYNRSNSQTLQDWPKWINGGYADIVIPLINQKEITQYEKVLSSQHPDSISLFRNTNRVFPGMVVNDGIYVMSVEFLLKGLEYDRKLGYNGEVFLFFEGLRKNDDRLAQTLRKTYYRQPAKCPF